MVYTNGVNDADYRNYLFCIIITLTYTVYILRLIYTNIIFAAGKFKDTQLYCVVECVLNLLISIALVKPLGIVGVAIGTLVSVVYRLFASVFYLSKDVLKRSFGHFFKHLIVDSVCFGCVVAFGNFLNMTSNNFYEWFLMAGIICCISLVLCFLIYVIAYPRQMVTVLKSAVNKFKKAN